jgi:hypothetical protein
MTAPGAIAYRRLRAPQNDGEALIDPPLADAVRVIHQNAALLAGYDFDLAGKSHRALAERARQELLIVAAKHTSRYRGIDRAASPASPLLLSGHQPQLFHPGVWFKHFVLASLAQHTGGRCVHLIVDNDTIREAAIRVPVRDAAGVRSTSIPLDASGPEIPFEERAVLDEGTFASFGARVEQAMAQLKVNSLIGRLWPLAAQRDESNLGLRVAKARNCFEEPWGVAALEAPLGEVCQTESFLWFACHLLAHAERFRADHNQALDDYRLVNRVRNRLRPVPALAARDEWVETPFWLWTKADPRRRKAFCRTRGRSVELTDRADLFIELPLAADRDALHAVGHLLEHAARGVKLRPRALITTLYARLFLGDLFLHGIGGAKYDQVTDAIVGRFFGVQAPEYATATATCRLPIERPSATNEQLQRLHGELNELIFHPETRLLPTSDLPAAAREMIDLKKRWIEASKGKLSVEERRQRHRDITRANEALAPLVADTLQALEAQRERLLDARRDESVLGSREFSFCLFPEEMLCGQLARLAGLA